MKNTRYIFILFVLMVGCNEVKNAFELPVMGVPEVVEREENGQIVYDTIPHQIAPFQFVDQDSTVITEATFADKIYVADFFFTSCPTICPIMKQQMLRVYEKYKDNPQVAILSHTIDPEYDNVQVLHDFAERLGVESSTWHFVTGDKEAIYMLAETSYFSVANEDSEAEGGYIHSGAFLLVDKECRIRGVYDGTIEAQVNVLLKDIDRLLKTYEKN